MYVNEQHDATCETACLDCLLTFDAQEPMQLGLLHRRQAMHILGGLLGENGNPLPADSKHSIGAVSDLPPVEPGDTTRQGPEKTSEERLKRRQQRMSDRSKHS